MDSQFKNKISKQPVLNVGMLGSVSDGKSTCVRVLTGIKTQRHSSEKTRNITIKPGYANLKIWSDGENVHSTDSKPTNYQASEKECELVHHLSFVDCPGHQELILTMLGSIKLMNAVIVVVSAADPLAKKPQLIQHLAAIKLSGLDNIIVCLNKLDLVSKEVAMERYQELQNLLKSYDIVPKTIIPTSFNKNIGISWLLEEILTHFNVPEETSDNACFLATRSFDINKAGSDWTDLKGGVIGGSLFNGTIKVNDIIEVRPGICGKGKDGKLISQPIKSKVLSVKTDQEELDKIFPGGLMGIGTDIDPYYCKDDMLAGNMIGLEGTLPSVYDSVELKYNIIEDFGGSWKPTVNDSMFLQIGTLSISSILTHVNKENIKLNLSRPACIDKDMNIIVSHKENGIMKIVASGTLYSGNKIVD
jgi:translation initiation factor 2 subunit 3